MFNTKILENLMVAFCFCITLALHLLIFNHYFSLQEGWWETYAYLVNRGEVINKDFYLAWTPLFVYINAFYQKIPLQNHQKFCFLDALCKIPL